MYILCSRGPLYGYHPKSSKTILIAKETFLQLANQIFSGCGIKITSGAVIGIVESRERYESDKVALCEIVMDDPQVAYAVYTKALCHWWMYSQRTVPGISHL